MNTQRSGLNRVITLSTKKWATGTAAMLLGASLVLSACSDSSEPVVQSTPVATMEAVGVATVVPEEGSETDVESTVMTDTAVLTDTEVTTEVITDTIETEIITETEVITETDVDIDTDVTTETEVTTETDGVTETGETGAVDTTSSAAMMGVAGMEAQQYVRASSLLDYDFENLNDEVSGDLEDLLIDLSTGRVLFTSIEYGGVLDLGDKDIVVPLNAFTVGAEGELILNIDEAELETYPDVGNDWPDLNDPVWDDDVNAYWNNAGIDVGPGFDTPQADVVWASDLIGENVADLGVGAGSVLDVLVDLASGYANYVIVDYGGGLDTDPYIIPLSAFDVSIRDEGLTYGPDFNADILENAPTFDRATYPEGTALDRDFGDRIESAWNDLGFSNDLNNDGRLD